MQTEREEGRGGDIFMSLNDIRGDCEVFLLTENSGSKFFSSTGRQPAYKYVVIFAVDCKLEWLPKCQTCLCVPFH